MGYSKLVGPVFTGDGQSEDVVLFDAYKAKDATPINSFQDLPATDTSALFPELGITPASAAVAAGATSSVITSSGVIDKINTAVPGTKNDLRSLSPSTLALLHPLDTLKKLSTINISGVVTTIRNGDLSSVKGVCNLINAVTKTTSMIATLPFDRGTTAGLISGITKESSALGIPNTFTLMANNVSDKPSLLAAGADLLKTAASDVRVLTDLANSPLARDIGMISPKLAKSVFGSISKAGKSVNQLVNEGTQTLGALRQLNSSWDRATQRPSAIDGTVFNAPSYNPNINHHTYTDYTTPLQSSISFTVDNTPTYPTSSTVNTRQSPTYDLSTVHHTYTDYTGAIETQVTYTTQDDPPSSPEAGTSDKDVFWHAMKGMFSKPKTVPPTITSLSDLPTYTDDVFQYTAAYHTNPVDTGPCLASSYPETAWL